MAHFARLTLLLLGFALVLIVVPVHAQGGLKVIDPQDITGFIENGVGAAKETLFINNEGDEMTGTLTISTLLKASSPPQFDPSPICIIVQVESQPASPCVSTFSAPVTFPANPSITRIHVTINAVKTPTQALEYGEATLITLFAQDSTRGDTTAIAEPFTFADYRKLFFVPSLYIANVMVAAAVFSIIILFAAVSYLAVREHARITHWLRHPLGEVTWGAQSWTAFLTALTSTLGVVALSGTSAGISLTTFNANVYTTTIASVGILFSVLPIIGAIVYRLLGRWAGIRDAKGGILLGYMITSTFTLYALVGSVLISSNVIHMLILSSLGITDPPRIPDYLLVVTVISLAVIAMIGVYFISHFRSDISAQLDDQVQQSLRAAKEKVLLDQFQSAWSSEKQTAAATLLALQALAVYDLPLTLPVERSAAHLPSDAPDAPPPESRATSLKNLIEAVVNSPKMSI